MSLRFAIIRYSHESQFVIRYSLDSQPAAMVAMAALQPLLGALKAQPQLTALLAALDVPAEPAVLLAAFGVAVLVTLLLLHTVMGALFGKRMPADAPPMLACAPLVGGFVKFLQVRPRKRRAYAGDLRRSPLRRVAP